MPYDSDEPTRPLEYPLYNSADYDLADHEVIGDAAFLTWATTDPDEKVAITLELSLNEYVALATAVDVGRDIAYGADSWQIWWVWIRAFSMAICEQVQECIETNQGVKDAIVNVMQEAGLQTPGTPLTGDLLTADLGNPNPTCDLDALYGSAVQIVQVTNRQIEDFLEVIEAITNNQEALSSALEFIPILGDVVPLPEIASFVQKIREWLQEAYVAGYDLSLETEFICDLFCIGKLECEITFETARNYFWGRAESVAGFGDAFESALTMLSALATWQEVAGVAVVEVMYGAAFGFMNYLSDMFGVDFASFLLRTRAGLPNDDWQFVCTDCSDTEACFNMLSTFMTVNQGVLISDYPNLPFARSETDGGQVEIRITFPEEVQLVSWWSQWQSLGSGANSNTRTIRLYAGGIVVATLYNNTALNGGYTWQVEQGTNGAGTSFDEVRLVGSRNSWKQDARLEVCVELPGSGGGGRALALAKSETVQDNSAINRKIQPCGCGCI